MAIGDQFRNALGKGMNAVSNTMTNLADTAKQKAQDFSRSGRKQDLYKQLGEKVFAHVQQGMRLPEDCYGIITEISRILIAEQQEQQAHAYGAQQPQPQVRVTMNGQPLPPVPPQRPVPPMPVARTVSVPVQPVQPVVHVEPAQQPVQPVVQAQPVQLEQPTVQVQPVQPVQPVPVVEETQPVVIPDEKPTQSANELPRVPSLLHAAPVVSSQQIQQIFDQPSMRSTTVINNGRGIQPMGPLPTIQVPAQGMKQETPGVSGNIYPPVPMPKAPEMDELEALVSDIASQEDIPKPVAPSLNMDDIYTMGDDSKQ